MKNPGFTLIEVIIYCALFSILMSGAVVTAYALISSAESTTAKLNLIVEASFINSKLSWSIMNADSIEIISSSIIKITRSDLGADSPLKISVSNNQFTLARGNKPSQIISAPQFIVTNVLFSVEGSLIYGRYTLNDVTFQFSERINQ